MITHIDSKTAQTISSYIVLNIFNCTLISHYVVLYICYYFMIIVLFALINIQFLYDLDNGLSNFDNINLTLTNFKNAILNYCVLTFMKFWYFSSRFFRCCSKYLTMTYLDENFSSSYKYFKKQMLPLLIGHIL